MTLLLTGVAGFIGAALASRLLRDGKSVFGIDNLCPYYDVTLKEARLALLQAHRYSIENIIVQRGSEELNFSRAPDHSSI